MQAAVTELNEKKSDKTPLEILSTHIKTLLLNGNGTYEDDLIAVVFACKALNDSKLSFQDKTTALDKIKKTYSKYKPDASDYVHHYYHQTDALKITWDDMVKKLPVEVVTQILGQKMPLEYLIARVPLDQLLKVVTNLGINRKFQFSALHQMGNAAAEEGISKEEGQDFFDRQYGTTPEEQLKAITDEFGKLPTEILADGTKLDFVNRRFINTWKLIANSDPKTTTSLDLSEIYLHRLPCNIGTLINLETLNLNYSQLTSLPKEIGTLINLTGLGLSSNRLTSLPKEIGGLINLTSLDLSWNDFTTLPKEIGNISNLTRLDLFGNKLTPLPKEIENLINLKTLNLSKNQFTSFPKEIGNLSNLTRLILLRNKFTSGSVER